MKNWLILLILTVSSPLFAAPPKVVVSIKPLFDVTTAVMEGVATPNLLVPPGASPHSYALTPSEAAALYEADLIIWVGPSLETFLSQALKQRKAQAKLMTMLEMPSITLYPYRSADNHDHGPIDPHLWLDLQNLMNFTSSLTNTLSKMDPENADKYLANKQRVIEHLKKLDQSVYKALAPYNNTPLMVFHDAYQYFERRYRLKVVGSIVLRPDTMPSVSRVMEIQERLKSEQVRCIFSEPQFKPAIVQRLVADTHVGYGVLDPLGEAIPVGLPGIEALFKNLADNIVSCVVGGELHAASGRFSAQERHASPEK